MLTEKFWERLRKNLKFPKNIKVTVEWWIRQLEKPGFEDSERGVMAEVAIARAIKKDTTFDDRRAMVFAKSLGEKISKDLKESETSILEVDAKPCPILLESVKKAKIVVFRFPWNTWSITTEDFVVVKHRFQDEVEVIWTKE